LVGGLSVELWVISYRVGLGIGWEWWLWLVTLYYSAASIWSSHLRPSKSINSCLCHVMMHFFTWILYFIVQC
jgi:hypothetical protein